MRGVNVERKGGGKRRKEWGRERKGPEKEDKKILNSGRGRGERGLVMEIRGKGEEFL